MNNYGALYSPWAENIAGEDISIVTGSEDAENPLSLAYDGLLNTHAYITPSGGSIEILWNHGSATRVDLFSLGPTNLPESAVVKIQRGGGVQDITLTVEQYADGFSNSPWANFVYNHALDIARPEYDVAGFTTTRLVITNAGAEPIGFKELWLGTIARQLDPNIQWGLREPLERLTTTRRSGYGGRLTYDRGVTMRGVIGSVNTSDAGYLQIRDLWFAIKGSVDPFLLIHEPVGIMSNDSMVCWWPERFDPRRQFFEDIDYSFEWPELSRGLRP